MENQRKGNSLRFDSNIACKTDTSEEVPARQKKAGLLRHEALKQRSGFTLVEVITVLTIIGILAAVAIPSMLGFIEHGKHVSRMNIARTLYLASQNQLSKSSVEKNLKVQLTGMYFNKTDGVYSDVIDDGKINERNVVLSLADVESSLSEEITSRKDFIHYISKKRGYTPPTDAEIEAMAYDSDKDEAKELRSFYYMLDEVIMDKAILNDAILMEYNVKTGVVLSIFYSDAEVEDFTFGYLGIDSDDRSNVTGGRGIDNDDGGYEFADARKQGYYGVESTGDVPSVVFDDVANIYDGADEYSAQDDFGGEVTENRALEINIGNKKINVLYAEFLLATQYEIGAGGIQTPVMPKYSFEIVDAGDKSTILSCADINLNGLPSLKTNFGALTGGEMLYSAGDAPYTDGSFSIDKYYSRYIWVLDYYEGDGTGNGSHRIGKTTDVAGNPISPTDVRAKATRDGGAEVTSLTIANTLFGSIMSEGEYEIKSARHLNNIRYESLDSDYRQTKDVEMNPDAANKIANFAPIRFVDAAGTNEVSFAGEYFAMKDASSQWRIKNLTIDTNSLISPPTNVGLFASLGSGGNIQGLSLFEASITAADVDNVGAVAGVLNGGSVKQSNSYANITVSGTGANVGGLVGHVISGTVERSFNAGFFNTHAKRDAVEYKTLTSEGYGSVTSAAGNIGGLVGLNNGEIRDCFNNARVNVKDVKVDADLLSYDPTAYSFSATSYLGGIAGSNSGTITASYATNFAAEESAAGSGGSTAKIGGIAGSGDTGVTDSYYIKNGCTDVGAVSKFDMYEMSPELSSAFVRGNVDGTGGYNMADISVNNLYRYYPYPIIDSNNPFADTSVTWGWEDIIGEDASVPQIVYYELYYNPANITEITWGYSGSYDIDVDTGEPREPLTEQDSGKLVVNDGYCIELTYHAGGYKLLIGDRVFVIRASGPRGGAAWTLAEVIAGEEEDTPIEWHTPQSFATDIGEVIYRLFIPNSIFESEGKLADVKLYRGADTELDADPDADPVLVEPKLEEEFNPLFADKTEGTVRSPRHIDNIDIVPDGAFTQELNVDFSLYYKELKASNQKMSLLSESVVMGAFTGTYDGNGKWIDNMVIKSSVNNIGLFESVKGSIEGILLDHAQINATGGTNVGAIAGTIDTGGKVQGVSVYKASIKVTNSRNVGAITGTMTGGLIEKCRSYANIDANSNTNMNVGGLVGNVSSGTIEQSFNAGFYNAPSSSSTSAGYGSVTGNRGYIGGLVGINHGIIKNSFNNARVNVANVSVTKDGEKLSYNPVFTGLSGKAYMGGITGYNNGGTVKNTYATNHVSLLKDNESFFGGIAGVNTNSGTLSENYFLSNGCASGAGSETISKADLRAKLLDTVFVASSPAAQNNLYLDYPYPVLSENKPPANWSYIRGRYECGWENIEDVRVANKGLLYYELYSDEAIGFSGGIFSPLVEAGSPELVANDGYVMDIANTPSEMTVKIGGASYTLTVTKDGNPRYSWSEGGLPASGIASVVQYTDNSSGIEETRFLLFFDNDFLESHANGASYIDFEVKTDSDTIISARFNPLFGNTVGRITDTFSIRSPRHFDNINKALDTDYSQGLNLDFSIYHKTATYASSGSTVTGDVTGAALSYDGIAVVHEGAFTGEYDGNKFYTRAVTADNGLFGNIGSGGTVMSVVLKESVIGKNDTVGGIAAVNDGTIKSCLVSGVTVNGDSGIGIVAGINNGVITDTRVELSKANSSADGGNIGGIAGKNNNNIEKCTVENGTDIIGVNYVGGIAGDNTAGKITECTVDSSEVSADKQYAGGIAGKNTAPIADCMVKTVTVKNTNSSGGSIGGIAGGNNVDGTAIGSISVCSVISSNILGVGSNVGGVAGNNASFIAKTGVSYTIVKSSAGSNAGGIAGTNIANGSVEDVFFLSVNDLDKVPVSAISNAGGIVGNNAGKVSRAFYHAPAPSTGDGVEKIIYPIIGAGDPAEKKGPNETCFYQAGFRYSLNEGTKWTQVDYNRIYERDGVKVVLKGGGMGLVTKFLTKEWLDFAYEMDLTNWYQPTTGFPYLMPNGLDALDNWPETDSPTRPDQLDRPEPEWGVTELTSNSAGKIGFINGGFELYSGYSLSGPPWDFFYVCDASNVNGWRTRMVNPDSSQSNISNKMELLFCNIQAPAATTTKYYGLGYFNAAAQQDGGYTWGYNRGDSVGLTRTNYQGTQEGVYAELNATTQNTLFQIAPTDPETTVVYSFYHATRHDFDSKNYFNGAYATPKRVNNAPDLMNFYLSGVADYGDTFVTYDGDGKRLIRPCATPRGTDTDKDNNKDSSPRWTRRPVAYGLVASFYNSKTKQFMSNKYLYDVWYGDDLDDDSGYGVTFWSSNPLVSEGVSGRLNLSEHELTKDDVETYKDNIIGYWDAVRFEDPDSPCDGLVSQWKQYYGEYTVPVEQQTTEFAFESQTATPSEGNFLDGITFKSPAFMSISKNIKDAAGAEANFVMLEDNLTVELFVKSYGEIAADNIKIVDRLSPYDDYIDYAGIVALEKITASGTEIINRNACTITEPDVNSKTNQTLMIEFPADMTLAKDEMIKVTFGIQVRKEVKSDPGLETLLYYFKNQAEVHYNQDKEANTDNFKGYRDNKRVNASDKLQVFIDPIKLTKTVSPDTEGPFTVTLTVHNTLEASRNINMKGLITDLIPKGFSVVNAHADIKLTPNADGSTRITIPNVSVAGTETKTYTYGLVYSGGGYGVTYTSVSADYKYQYIDDYVLSVMLEFPQNLVGISIKTQDDDFIVGGGATSQLLNLTANDNFAERMFAANYEVKPEVVLTNSSGVTINPNNEGEYVVSGAGYTARLQLGTGNLQIVTSAGVSDTIEFYYKILLTATKPNAKTYELSSRMTKVTIRVRNDSLVYYEKYHDDSYGFNYASGSGAASTLNDVKAIVESGYGVLSAAQNGSAQIGGGAVSSTPVNCNGMYLYKLDTAPAADFGLQTVKFGTAGMSDIGKIHPSFANAVYPMSATNADDTIYIRAPQQMINIGKVDATGKTFIQALDLDFDGFDMNADGAVVKGVFNGTFDGNSRVIRNVDIDFPGNYAGLFSQNSHIIRGVKLRPNTRIIGNDYVGGIAGHNLAGGVIQDCSVEGDSVTLGGMHIGGNENVGGIAGFNEGSITDCTVSNTKYTIKGTDCVGGITGRNGANGDILRAMVYNVRIEADANFGIFFGLDDSGALVEAVIGNSDKVDLPDNNADALTAFTFQVLPGNQLEAPADTDADDPENPVSPGNNNGPGGAADSFVVAVAVIVPLCSMNKRKKNGVNKEDGGHAKTK